MIDITFSITTEEVKPQPARKLCLESVIIKALKHLIQHEMNSQTEFCKTTGHILQTPPEIIEKLWLIRNIIKKADAPYIMLLLLEFLNVRNKFSERNLWEMIDPYLKQLAQKNTGEQAEK